MRILQVLEAAGAGAFGVVSSLVDRLDRAGHDVTLAVGRRPETPDHLEQLIPAGVSVVHLPWQRRTLRAQPPAARALRSVVADLRPDVVHLHSSIAGAIGMIVRGRGVTLYTPHGYSFSSGSPNSGRMVVQRMVERMVAQRCDMVVAVSEAEGRLARDVIRARRVCVIPNGIPELDDPPDVAPRTGRPLVAAVGRIVFARSPAATARILAAVTDVADVTWIGQAPHDEDGPLRSLGVPITGWLDHGEAVARLARASVMVHWSAGDGASLAVLEAMAVGTAVVASDIPANRELLGDAQVAVTEAEAIARVRRLLVDEPARARTVVEQRRRAAARGANLMAERHLALYAELLSGATVDPARAAAVGT